MSKSLYIGNASVARKSKKGYIGNSSVARTIKKGYVGSGGVAHQFFSPGGSGPSSTDNYIAKNYELYKVAFTSSSCTLTLVQSQYATASSGKCVIYKGRVYSIQSTYENQTWGFVVKSTSLSDVSDTIQSPMLQYSGYYIGSGQNGYSLDANQIIIANNTIYFPGRYGPDSSYSGSNYIRAGYIFQCTIGSDNSISQLSLYRELWRYGFSDTSSGGQINLKASYDHKSNWLIHWAPSSHYSYFSSDYNTWVMGVGSQQGSSGLSCPIFADNVPMRNWTTVDGVTDYSNWIRDFRTSTSKSYSGVNFGYNNSRGYFIMICYDDSDGAVYGYSSNQWYKTYNWSNGSNAVVFTLIGNTYATVPTNPDGYRWNGGSFYANTAVVRNGVMYVKPNAWLDVSETQSVIRWYLYSKPVSGTAYTLIDTVGNNSSYYYRNPSSYEGQDVFLVDQTD